MLFDVTNPLDGGSREATMSDELDDRSYFFNRRTDKTIVSKRITDRLTGRELRIVSKIVDGSEGLRLAKAGDELVLRTTPAGRYEIKATVYEDDRSITTLTIQKFNAVSGPHEKHHFSFVGYEIEELLAFVAGIRSIRLPDGQKVHVTDEQLRDVVLNRSQAEQVFADHEALFVEVAENAALARDIVAVGYRRKQLERFEALLGDADYLASELVQNRCTPEALWQSFFEANTWIFGYGLTFQFLSGLDGRKLEQVVRGHDVEGPGKRADALLKTRGYLNSICFTEIKRHDTPLLELRPYRPGSWAPSHELIGGVSQVQATVQSAREIYARTLEPVDSEGNPTGETLFNIEPRAFLVVGSLSQFLTNQGINEQQFRSFELYRRNTLRPEIITFDELLERARYIVEHRS
jgi:hypothetical protein